MKLFRLFVIRNSCGEPYLIRWSFFELFGYSLKLHIILRSDDDRSLHDHPWTFITWMLAGGYWEHTFTKVKGETERKWIAPGTLRRCKAPYAHRLELAEELPIALPAEPTSSQKVIEGCNYERHDC